MTEKRIVLVVDHPQRDLAGIVLTAMKLCSRGVVCFLTPFNMAPQEIWALRPDFVVLNHLRKTTVPLVEMMTAAGISFAVLDTEGASWSSPQEYTDLLPESTSVRARTQKFCIWGSQMAAHLVEHGHFRAEQVAVTGCPRFDFYAPEWRSVLDDSLEDSPLRAKHILVNSNYTVVNSRFKTVEENIDIHLALGMTSGRIQEMVDHERAGLAQTIAMVRNLGTAYSDCRIVLRPHPFENPETYRLKMGSLSNIHINDAGPVQPQLFRAAVVIQRSCTTAAEALMAGVPTLSPQWVTPNEVIPLLESISVPCHSFEDMRHYLDQILAETYVPDEKIRLRDEAVTSDWFGYNDGLSHERVSEALLIAAGLASSPNDKKCSRLLYGMVGSDTPLSYATGTMRYGLGLPPQWSFHKMRRIPPVWTRPAKFFGAAQVTSLIDRVIYAAAQQQVEMRPIVAALARDTGDYAHEYVGHSVMVRAAKRDVQKMRVQVGDTALRSQDPNRSIPHLWQRGTWL